MKKQIELGPFEAFCQKWEESEEGWGVRPDGFSLHISIEGVKRYIAEYWNTLPNEEVPREYSRPSGTPYLVGVGRAVMDLLIENSGSLRFSTEYQYPGSGGIDGWMPTLH